VTVRIGVVGLGYWGPNVVRNMARVADLAWCCDLSAESRDRYAPQYPQARFTADFDDLLNDPALDAIAVASSVPTHHPLGLKALAAGKHVFIEKPLAGSVADARELVQAAERGGRRLMVGHLLLFHPALRAVRSLIDSGELGDIYYLYGNRVNLGQVRADENALWSLGAHDVAVLLDLVGERPIEAQARGECYVRPGIEDVVFGYLRFPSGAIAHLHLSWLDPHKMRRLTVVGSKKMVVFDDMETDRKLTIYDKSASRSPSTDSYGEYVSVRFGDISIPRIANDEPLRLECQEFVDAITEGREPRCNGHEGLAVVEVLEALQVSLDDGGRVVEVPA
jgi:predicted dehydrogenase